MLINSFSPKFFVKNNNNSTQINNSPVKNHASSDVFSKSKVSFGNTEEITTEKLKKIKEGIDKTLTERHFSPNVIRYTKSFTTENNYRLIQLMAGDLYTHSSRLTWAACFSENNAQKADLMADAALKRNYQAFGAIFMGTITKPSQIEDKKHEVTKEYHPKWKEIPKYTREQIQEEKNNIAEILEKRNFSKEDVDYVKSFVDAETVNFIKEVVKDKDCSKHEIRWASGYANIENEELLRYALKLKDYDAFCDIVAGKIREKSEIDARKTARNEKKSYNNGRTNDSGKTTDSGKTDPTSSSGTTKNNSEKAKEQFISFIDEKTKSRRFTISQLSPQEIKCLAELFGTDEKTVTNMDKKNYKILCKKFHSDKNNGDSNADTIFIILKNIYDKSPSKNK